MMSVVDNAFDFIFIFPSDKVRWWSGKVLAMGSCLMIG